MELKGHPEVEAAGMLWPAHLDPMQTVYPALGRVQCPVSILAGSDVSATNPTEFIAFFIEEVTQEFPKGRFERCAMSLEPACIHSLLPFLSCCCVPQSLNATLHPRRNPTIADMKVRHTLMLRSCPSAGRPQDCRALSIMLLERCSSAC